MNLKTIYNKITKDIHAISPVVATLVLIVVAIIGAAAVGVMTGALTEDVGEQEVDPGITGGSLIIGGSTTVYPSAKNIARGFMEANPGVRVIVQAGGSGAGISAVGRNIIDIGMSSRIGGVDAGEAARYPALANRIVQIGNSMVILVAHQGVHMGNATHPGLNNVTAAELRDFFLNGTIAANITAAGVTRGVFRADVSGTASEFAGMMGTTEYAIRAAARPTVIFRDGNRLVFEAIRDTSGTMGGIDMGYAVEPAVTRTTAPHFRRLRPLIMITHEEPSKLEQAFLNYARSPGARPYFIAAGQLSLYCPIPAA